ncbi:MAG: amidohydrolase family protein [Acidobacteriota bacterium]
MIIDSHQHFWRYDRRRYDWITDEMEVLRRDFLPADLLSEYQASGVDGSIAVQADQSERETRFLLELAEQNDFIKGVVGWVDLRDANLPLKLAYFAQFKKLCGFRHIVQSEPDDDFLLREDFLRGVGYLQDFDFTYDILIYPKQLSAAIKFVEQKPDHKFVVDHLAKPFIKDRMVSPWREQMQELARHENVYCKVSGMVTEADWQTWQAEDFKPYLDVIFEAFGSERVMFGSDWPVCLVAASYEQVKNLITDYLEEFSESQRANIMGLNAARFYDLQV